METKKLTCFDLMVGDYAKLSKGNWSEIRQLELIDIEMIAEGVYFAEAIPITAAILEKNGWYIPTNSSWWHNNEIDFYLVGYTDGSFQIYTDEDSEFSNLCRINHFHELQNLYRICRISKEIVP